MERNLYAPLMNEAVTEKTRPAYLKWLERLEVKHVFLACGQDAMYTRGEERSALLKSLRENIEYFHQNGYTVGVWLRSYGFGTPFTEKQMEIVKNYVPLRSVIGNEWADAICPENEYFATDYADFARDVATVSPDMIMMDDDFCVSVRPGLGCFCGKHRAIFNELVGENIAEKDLPKLLFTGGKNKYRSAWLQMVGDSHRKFARRVRAAIDSVDPAMRAGFCAGFTSWDIEGVDAIELTKILAGNTTPFLRFTGAPYWATRGINRFQGQPLCAVIEDARVQEKWCRESGVEVFCESDTYPRPRAWTSSSMMECFALPLWASGGMGELGYFFDYVSTPDYETGYYKHRIANKPLYDFVKRHMADKPAYGVRVYNEMRKFENVDFPEEFAGEDFIMSTYFNRGSEFLAAQGIPTTYDENAACAIAFGEDARYVEKMPPKMILDIRAAKILTERGVDVGLVSAEAAAAGVELFPDERLNLSLCGNSPFGSAFYRATLKDGARVESEFGCGEDRFPASYRYTANGTEYLVFTFDAWTSTHFSAALLSYKRQRQLVDFIGDVAILPQNPGVYQLAKRDGEETALLFVNICEDSILDGVIELDRSYTEMELCGATGVLEGDKIRLTAPVPAFGMFAVVLK